MMTHSRDIWSIFALLLSLSLLLIHEAKSEKLQNITVAQYDARERAFLLDLNLKRVAQGLSQIKPSRLLTNYAQREANRSAKVAGLIYPQIDFLDRHFGYAIKIMGQKNGVLVGEKICFDNLFVPADTRIHDMNANCNSKLLNQDMASEVGYGRAVDLNGLIYIVRIFRTNQNNH